MINTQQEASLLSGGDCFLHWHSQDRVATHTFLKQLQGLVREVAVTASGDISRDWDLLMVDSTAGDVTLTLPLITTENVEVEVVKTVAANAVIVQGAGSDTVMGTTDVTMYPQWTAMRFRSTDNGWVAI